VYKVEDKILFYKSKIVLHKTSAFYVHGISYLPHYVLALEEGIDPKNLVYLSLKTGSSRMYSAWIFEKYTLTMAQ
jgi:hypothetical protein